MTFATLHYRKETLEKSFTIVRIIVAILVLSLLVSGSVAAEYATLTGKVVDNRGRPIEHAMVLIYHAGVKKGYSTFCPSCYADCGKRAITEPDGMFVIKTVDSNLLFELLAVKDGFQPTSVKGVDPLDRSIPKVVLAARLPVKGAEFLVRGLVVDDHGRPLRDAIVQPTVISMNELPDGTATEREVSVYGTVEGVEPIAISDAKGEFEIKSQKRILGMLLTVEARGFAPKMQALAAGMERKTITISPGAVIRGRLVDHGTPVADAQIGLIARNRGGFGGHLSISGDPYEEIRVGTQADGSFTLADVPSPVKWYVYAKMESLRKGLASRAVECSTTQKGEVVDVGDLPLEPGHRLKGRIVLHDGVRIPDGMRVILSADRVFDGQVVPIQSDGAFEFSGLPTGSYDINPAVRGYHLTTAIRNILIDHDIDDFTIALDPNSRHKQVQ